MVFDVALSEGKVLLDVDRPIPCALTVLSKLVHLCRW